MLLPFKLKTKGRIELLQKRFATACRNPDETLVVLVGEVGENRTPTKSFANSCHTQAKPTSYFAVSYI